MSDFSLTHFVKAIENDAPEFYFFPVTHFDGSEGIVVSEQQRRHAWPFPVFLGDKIRANDHDENVTIDRTQSLVDNQDVFVIDPDIAQ